MIIKIQSPFKRMDRIDKTVNLPTPVKLTDGTLFYTFFPERLGSTGNYQMDTNIGQMYGYSKCSPINSIINKQADALKNGRFMLVDGKGNEVKSDNKYLSAILQQANPLQTFRQFLGQAYAYMKIHGVAYCLPVFGLNRTEPTSFYVVPNFLVQPQYTRKMFMQTELKDIISGFKIEGIAGIIPPENMLMLMDSSVPVDQTLGKMVLPQSRMISIADSINSVIASTDAWYTIARRKGLPLGIISSGGKDATSTIPLTKEQKDEVHGELNEGYGMSASLKKFIITSASLNFQGISVPTKDLMLLEGIEAHSRIICNAYNYPFRLLEYDSGSSLSNGGEVKEARKTLYVEQIIPDAETICSMITNWFGMKGMRLAVYYDHLEIFQKSKEETARAIMSLTAGLDRALVRGVITKEEYRMQLSEIMNIDPDNPYGKTYYSASAPDPKGEGANQA